MMEKQLKPAELFSRLSVAAVELYALGRLDAAGDVAIIRSALPLIAKATGESHADTDDLIQLQHDLMVTAPNALEPPLVMDVDDLFLDPSGEDLLAVANTLLTVIVALTDQSEREIVADLLRFLVDFWEIEEHFTY